MLCIATCIVFLIGNTVAYPAMRTAEIPSIGPKTDRFQLKNAEEVVKIMKDTPGRNQDLIPILQRVITSISNQGNLTHEGQAMLKDMLVTFSRQAEQGAKDAHDQPLSEEQLKTILSKMGLKEGDTNYDVSRSRQGNVKILVEEEETDDPTAKDQIILDYKKEVDKSVNVDGAEQDDDDS